MKQRYESGERTPELVDAYAMSFMEQKKMDEGYKIIDDYFNSLSDNKNLHPKTYSFSHATRSMFPIRNVNSGLRMLKRQTARQKK